MPLSEGKTTPSHPPAPGADLCTHGYLIIRDAKTDCPRSEFSNKLVRRSDAKQVRPGATNHAGPIP